MKKLKNGRVFPSQVYPKFSILNPEYTYSVPQYQMISGIFDIMSHLMEQYFSGNDDNTTDYIIKGLLDSLINSARVAIKNPENYEARSLKELGDTEEMLPFIANSTIPGGAYKKLDASDILKILKDCYC